MTAPVMPEATPASYAGGPDGVLVLHGFTGNPGSMRSLASAFAAAGYTVELPLLPGHGTVIEDMLPTRWADWSGAADAAYRELAGRCRSVAVAGLSMGGTLATWLAAEHPETSALMVVNPAIEAQAELLEGVQALLEAGTEIIDGIGSDIAMPGVVESAYPQTPLAPLVSLMRDGVEPLGARLADVRCPVLLCNSPQDHVVPPSSSDVLAAGVSGPVERVTLARSYHVATMDFDKDEIERRAVDFLAKVLAGA